MDALQYLFPSLRTFPNFPTEHDACYIFFNAAQREWITIPKLEVSERDFQLLSAVWVCRYSEIGVIHRGKRFC